MRAELKTRSGKTVTFWCDDRGGCVYLESDGCAERLGRRVWDTRELRGCWLRWTPADGDLATFLRAAADEAPRGPWICRDGRHHMTSAHRPAQPAPVNYECTERKMTTTCETPPQYVPKRPWAPYLDLDFKV